MKKPKTYVLSEENGNEFLNKTFKPLLKLRAKKLPATIPCQACNGRSGNGIGCGVCGGYGFVLQRIECPLCKRQCLMRPGVHTMYEGKRYRSLDGLEFIYHMGSGVNCIHCEKEE